MPSATTETRRGQEARALRQDPVHGLTALTHTDAGKPVLPETAADWADWVAATKTRNWAIGDPLLDWLNLYGTAKGFTRDDELPGYDERCDFTRFVFRQAERFEVAAIRHLRDRVEAIVCEDTRHLGPVVIDPGPTLLTIARSPADIRSLDKALETVEAMRAGVPVIHQGVLRDPENRVYGAPDLLVRSDVLARLFPGSIEPAEAARPAPGLGGRPWHYRVVDVKYTTLDLLAGGDLGNGGSQPAYKIQFFLYHRALARIQGTGRTTSYLLGRGWRQTIEGDKRRNSACRRHPERWWPRPRWFDLLERVFRVEPLVVRGAFGFGLKDVAQALRTHGLIETAWEGSALDGLGAMAGGVVEL
jgi:hypothetical protein